MKPKNNLDDDITSRFEAEQAEVFDELKPDKRNKFELVISIFVAVIILATTLYQLYRYLRG